MQFPMASDLISRGNRMLMMPYGDLWRRERKMMHQIPNSSQLKNFEHFQDTESALLMADYLREPEKWYLPHGRFANSNSLRTTMNHTRLSFNLGRCSSQG